jgi:putative hydrolase of the HAD superfamily
VRHRPHGSHRRRLILTARFDAVWLDAGGVLVLPDPTVLGPLLAYYGGANDVDRHRRAHYAAMAVKSAQGAEERDWREYDRAYVGSIGVTDGDLDEAAAVLGEARTAALWRWPIPESVTALAALAAAGVPLGVVSNASGQIEAVLRRSRVCVVDSHVVGVAKPDPRIFDFAAAHFDGIDRRRVCYVGDSITMDITGASAAGVQPILLDPFDDHPGADFARIGSLTELVP